MLGIFKKKPLQASIQRSQIESIINNISRALVTADENARQHTAFTLWSTMKSFNGNFPRIEDFTSLPYEHKDSYAREYERMVPKIIEDERNGVAPRGTSTAYMLSSLYFRSLALGDARLNSTLVDMIEPLNRLGFALSSPLNSNNSPTVDPKEKSFQEDSIYLRAAVMALNFEITRRVLADENDIESMCKAAFAERGLVPSSAIIETGILAVTIMLAERRVVEEAYQFTKRNPKLDFPPSLIEEFRKAAKRQIKEFQRSR